MYELSTLVDNEKSFVSGARRNTSHAVAAVYLSTRRAAE